MTHIIELVDCMFRIHPPECVFAPGARERIIAALEAAATGGGREASLIALATAFRAEEVYCSHEGIDRRAEFGLATNG